MNVFGLPDLGLGIGFRHRYAEALLEDPPAMSFIEILSENFMGTSARAQALLERLADRYRLVLHGVSMSIGSTDPLDTRYLGALRALAQRCNAAWVSDHFAWTGALGRNTHDLLPLSYSEASLKHVVSRAHAVSDFLGRPLVLENPSSYFELRSSEMSEVEWISRVAEEADIGLLVDVNNVFVSAQNHGFDAHEWIDRIPVDRIVQVHVAGHTDKGTHLLDTHSERPQPGVWALYQRLVQRRPDLATLLEWDDDLPEFPVLLEELEVAARAKREALRVAA